jgi:hypothetical protein
MLWPDELKWLKINSIYWKNNKYTDERKHTMYIVHELYKKTGQICQECDVLA